MRALGRWIAFLLLWHLLVVCLNLTWDSRGPVWAGCLLAFSLPTIQFTWSLTTGLCIGPSRSRRKLYWIALLCSFIPLKFICLLAWLLNHFVGPSAAVTAVIIGLFVLAVETFAGIYCGMKMRHHLLDA